MTEKFPYRIGKELFKYHRELLEIINSSFVIGETVELLATPEQIEAVFNTDADREKFRTLIRKLEHDKKVRPPRGRVHRG